MAYKQSLLPIHWDYCKQIYVMRPIIRAYSISIFVFIFYKGLSHSGQFNHLRPNASRRLPFRSVQEKLLNLYSSHPRCVAQNHLFVYQLDGDDHTGLLWTSLVRWGRREWETCAYSFYYSLDEKSKEEIVYARGESGEKSNGRAFTSLSLSFSLFLSAFLFFLSLSFFILFFLPPKKFIFLFPQFFLLWRK